MNSVHVTELAWDVWVCAKHMSKEMAEIICSLNQITCVPYSGSNYTCGGCMGVLGVTAVRCFPDLGRELELGSWAVPG